MENKCQISPRGRLWRKYQIAKFKLQNVSQKSKSFSVGHNELSAERPKGFFPEEGSFGPLEESKETAIGGELLWRNLKFDICTLKFEMFI